MISDIEIDAALVSLDQEMADLQLAHRDVFSFANAWAVRYDALVARVPVAQRAYIEQRLHRIGVRWGVANGVRMTGQFPAIKLAD